MAENIANKILIEGLATDEQKTSMDMMMFDPNSYSQRSLPAILAWKSTPWKRYAVALTIVIAAAAVRWLVMDILGFRAPFITFYPAVMLATLCCGFPAGILATCLSALMASYLFVEPQYQLTARHQADWIALTIFILCSSAVAYLSAVLRQADIRGIEAEAQLRVLRERTQSEDELRRYARRLIEMEENLRKKLAAELHDEIGRDLTAIGMNMSIISHSMAGPVGQKLLEKIDDSSRLIEGVSRTVRNIMAGLRPPVLDDYGLPATLRWHADLFSARTGIAITVQADDSFPRLAVEKEIALFRIAQEALMNAAKHANTQIVTIRLSVADGVIRLAIADEGSGFITASPSPLQKSAGWGMKIMRERAEAIGGFFHVDSVPGKGAAVSVVLAQEEA